MIDVEKHNINAGNSTYCADVMISDYAIDRLISAALDAVNLTDFLAILKMN